MYNCFIIFYYIFFEICQFVNLYYFLFYVGCLYDLLSCFLAGNEKISFAGAGRFHPALDGPIRVSLEVVDLYC